MTSTRRQGEDTEQQGKGHPQVTVDKQLMQRQDFSLEPSATTLEDAGDDLLCVPHLLGATRSVKIRERKHENQI